MTLRDFIRENREEIDEHIQRVCYHFGDIHKLNDTERADWVRNDETLYRWARTVGWRG